MTETVWYVAQQVLPAALSLLPGRMDTIEARAMLLAIGYQESDFAARRQGGNGPARGFWQFEKNGGVKEIITSDDTKSYILPILKTMCYAATPDVCHAAIQDNDVLAAVFARLLLYRDQAAMPPKTNAGLGWRIYQRNWRPGKPHPERWPANFTSGWFAAEGGHGRT